MYVCSTCQNNRKLRVFLELDYGKQVIRKTNSCENNLSAITGINSVWKLWELILCCVCVNFPFPCLFLPLPASEVEVDLFRHTKGQEGRKYKNPKQPLTANMFSWKKKKMIYSHQNVKIKWNSIKSRSRFCTALENSSIWPGDTRGEMWKGSADNHVMLSCVKCHFKIKFM